MFTAQGKVGELISELFNINHDYIGSLVSTIAKVGLNPLYVAF